MKNTYLRIMRFLSHIGLASPLWKLMVSDSEAKSIKEYTELYVSINKRLSASEERLANLERMEQRRKKELERVNRNMYNAFLMANDWNQKKISGDAFALDFFKDFKREILQLQKNS